MVTSRGARNPMIVFILVRPGLRWSARSAFLPGAWSVQRAPLLPVEEWNVGMYRWAGDTPTPWPDRQPPELFRLV